MELHLVVAELLYEEEQEHLYWEVEVFQLDEKEHQTAADLQLDVEKHQVVLVELQQTLKKQHQTGVEEKVVDVDMDYQQVVDVEKLQVVDVN